MRFCPGRPIAPLSRREMLRTSALGFGWLALGDMIADAQQGTHHRPRAKNVIFCFMDGGVSHVDSFDPKPELDRQDGRPFRDSQNPTAPGIGNG